MTTSTTGRHPGEPTGNRVPAWCACGWHGEYDTTARAEFARRKHSCQHWRAKRAAARRGADRLRAIDRTPKPCHHTQARHEHGTYAAYKLDDCRCPACARAASEYGAELNRRNAYGRSNLVDATPVRAHVHHLADAGIGLKQLAKVSGVAHSTLVKLVHGTVRSDGSRTPSSRVRRDTAAKILAISPSLEQVARGAHVNTVGARRRIQALATVGWSIPRIAAEAGLPDRQRIDHALTGRQITADTARAVAAAYDRLWDRPPPEDTQRERISASRTRKRAQDAGWAPPLAWDDDTIDDPRSLPAPGWRTGECSRPGCPGTPLAHGLCSTHYHQQRQGRGGGHNRDDLDSRLDDLLHLIRAGEHPDRAARRCDWAGADVVRKTAHQRGRDDVLDELARHLAQ